MKPAFKYFIAIPVLIFIFIFAILITGCNKIPLQKNTTLNQTIDNSLSVKLLVTGPPCISDQETVLLADSILKPTLLGVRLIGMPYSVVVMQQAALQVLGTSAGVVENAWYMRFKPTGYDQLITLEDQDIDLFDYPLNYEVVQEGDYYDDGITPAETIPWLYAVVPTNFVTPAGITSELLQRMHVPDDYRVENKAFLNTGNNVDTADCFSSVSNILPEPCSGIDYCNANCPEYDPTFCGGSGGGGSSVNIKVPAGNISVSDDIFNNNISVRKARVVARRFLKVQRVFTDNSGHFQFTKSFRNKTTLLLKFKNDNAIIKGLRGARLWQILMPVKIKMGTYRGNLSNITYNVDDNNNLRSRGARHWAAATMHNKVQEFTDLAIGFTPPPNKLRVLIMPGVGSGSTPMFAKRIISTLPATYIRTKIISYTIGPFFANLALLTQVLVSRVDMTVGYNGGGNATAGSAGFSETAYHELAHASHYAKVGNSWWGDFVSGELSEIFNNIGTANSPYGNGTSSNSPIIALGESWAYHIGHSFTAARYGTLSPEFFEQTNPYRNNFPLMGLNSNLNLLEDFDPNRVVDPFRWIPQGLYYDMIDVRNDAVTPPIRITVTDEVSLFTNLQLFAPLQSDVTSLQQYRLRLQQQNTGNQTIQITNLFAQYGY